MNSKNRVGLSGVVIISLLLIALSGSAAFAAGMLSKEGSKDPVVLVHGYSGSVLGQLSVSVYWSFIGTRLAVDGFDVYKVALSDAGLQDVKKSAEELKTFVDGVLAKTGKSKVDLVAHSEGGLVSRYYIKNLGGADKVDDLVTISTPHRGTAVASIGPGMAARQMEIYSPFLRELNTEPTLIGNVDYTAIHSSQDEVAFPTENGFFRDAVNIHFTMLGHAGILFNEDVYQSVKGGVSNDVAENHRAIPIKILSDRMTTNKSTVTVRLKKFNHNHQDSEVKQMRMGTAPILHAKSWTGFQDTVQWNLDTSSDGIKAVHVQYREKDVFLLPDKESPVYVDYIFFDSTQPEAQVSAVEGVTTEKTGHIKINATDNSDNFKTLQIWNIPFAYGIEDLGVKEMIVSADANFAGAAWQPYSKDAAVDLGAGSGRKTIYVKVRDGAGNESKTATTSILVADPLAGDIGMVAETGKEPVILVHGYGGSVVGDVSAYINWVYINEKLKNDGFTVKRITLSEGGLQDVTKSAEELRSFIAGLLAETGAKKVDVVCHSEGGLVARYYIQKLGGAQFVDDLVTISTPHRGTTVAAIGPGLAARQMEVNSDFLKGLNSGDTMPGDVSYTALFSHGDEIVVPGMNGFFDGAVNINYTQFDHALILFHPDPYKVVKASLENKYVFNKGERPVEIDEPGMSTAKKQIAVKIKACNHYAPQMPVTQMLVATNAGFSGAGWQPLAKNTTLDISGIGNGLLGVHVKFKGADGVESPSYADYIILDREAPKGSVEIGKVNVDAKTAELSISASDNTDKYASFKVVNLLEAYGISGLGANEIMTAGSEDFAGSSWEPVSFKKTWNLSPGVGKKTVYTKFKDASGNVSQTYSASAYLFDRVNGYMAAEETKNPVVFVHGYMGSIVGDVSSYINWVYYKEKLSALGYSTHILTISNAAMQDITISANELKTYVDSALAKTGAKKVDIICHSEGGLVSRYYIKNLGGAAFVDDLVTIATPHRGTVMAAIGPGQAARQMEVGSDFLKSLNSGDTTPGMVDYTAVFSNQDTMVIPQQNGFFAGAININVNKYDHALILFNDEVFNAVKGALDLDVGHENSALPIYIEKTGMVTNSQAVKLSINYYNHYDYQYPPSDMMISNNPLFTDAKWQPVSKSVTWALDGGDGLKGVYVKFRSSVTNTVSPAYADYIVLDVTKPEGLLVAKDFDPVKNTVRLIINASDNSDELGRLNLHNLPNSFGITGIGVSDMMLWNSDDFTGAIWQQIAGEKAWSLVAGEGPKKVYMKLRDAAGNVSAVISINVSLTKPEDTTTSTTTTTTTTPVDVSTLLSFDEGWNLVFMPDALPEIAKDSIKSVVDQYKNFFDISKMDFGKGSLVNLPDSASAVWMYIDKPVKFSLNYKTDGLAKAAANEIPLKPGWNIIGFSGAKELPVDKVSVVYGKDSITLDEAGARNLVNPSFFSFDKVKSKYLPTTSLQPFHAYFIKAKEHCILSIP